MPNIGLPEVGEAFDDPKIAGVTCCVSRSQTGGGKGGLGLAEDPSDAAIACRQVGPIVIKEKLKGGEEAFTERRSLLFENMRVVRFLDQPRNTLVYRVYSDKLIEGSSKNSVSAVAMMPWGDQPPKPAPQPAEQRPGDNGGIRETRGRQPNGHVVGTSPRTMKVGTFMATSSTRTPSVWATRWSHPNPATKRSCATPDA